MQRLISPFLHYIQQIFPFNLFIWLQLGVCLQATIKNQFNLKLNQAIKLTYLTFRTEMEFFPPQAYWLQLRKRRMVMPPGHLHPSFEAFNKYLECYADSYTLTMRKEELQLKHALLKARIARLENNLKQPRNRNEQADHDSAPKRRRRLAEDIERAFECPYERCRKVYATLGSLQQHQRLKHFPEGAASVILIDDSS